MKEFPLTRLDIPERVAEHIWARHRIYRWQVFDVIDDPDTKFNGKSDSRHGYVLIGRGRDRGGMPLILYISIVDSGKGHYRLRTARRPDKNEYKRFFQ